MTAPTQALSDVWEGFAERHCKGYSPLYERISRAIAGDPEVLEMVRGAPPAAHMPPVLLAAVHYLLLGGLDDPLADVYAGRSQADPGPLFLALCRAQRDAVTAVLDTRHLQTNECGRSALIGPALTWLASRFETALGLIDVGTSAGLNLLCDRYRLDYGDHGATGPAESPVELRCRVVAGRPPIAERLPALASRVGIDREPVDLSDPDDARWQLACVWPDTGRFERTEAAISLARHSPPPVIGGDANEVLGDALRTVPESALAVLVTTWAFAYFSIEQRADFVALLDGASRRRRIAWVSAEGAGVVDAFAGAALPHHEEAVSDVMGLVTFDGGGHREQLLAFVQPHGHWIDWRAQ